jgi:hypothetical protein
MRDVGVLKIIKKLVNRRKVVAVILWLWTVGAIKGSICTLDEESHMPEIWVSKRSISERQRGVIFIFSPPSPVCCVTYRDDAQAS